MTSKLTQSIFKKYPDFEEFSRTYIQSGTTFYFQTVPSNKQKAFLVLAASSVKVAEVLTDIKFK